MILLWNAQGLESNRARQDLCPSSFYGVVSAQEAEKLCPFRDDVRQDVFDLRVFVWSKKKGRSEQEDEYASRRHYTSFISFNASALESPFGKSFLWTRST
jgi:hypothetical protein